MDEIQRDATAGAPADDDQVRERLNLKLRRGQIPRELPSGIRIPGGNDRERITIGGGHGFQCSACDTLIGHHEVSAMELRYRSGAVLRFHRRCSELWLHERHRPHPSA